MPMSGTIEEGRLEEIFQFIGRERKTGVLSCEKKNDLIRVYFRAGAIVDAESSVRPLHMRLGAMLVQSERITQEQLLSAVNEQKSSTKPLGEILVERGWVTEDDVARFKRRQLTDTVFQVLRWVRGEFHFLPAEVEAGPTPPLRADTIAFEKVWREDEWRELRRRFPANKARFVTCAERPQHDLELQRLYDLIRADRSLADLLRLGQMGERETLRALASLIDLGAVKFAAEDPPSGPLGLKVIQREYGFEKLVFCPKCLLVYKFSVWREPPKSTEICPIDGTKLEAEIADPLVGRRIDRYVIGERIAEGHSGRIYSARHVLLDREFALKVYYGGVFKDRVARDRFKSTAAASAKVRHPNVVRIEECFLTGELTVLVMERIFGASLYDSMGGKNVFGHQDAATIFRQIVTGLAAAHAAGFRLNSYRATMLDEDGNVKLSKVGLNHPGDERGEPPARTDLFVAASLYRQMRRPEPPPSGDPLRPVVERILLQDETITAEEVLREIDRRYWPVDLSSSNLGPIVVETSDLEPLKREPTSLPPSGPPPRAPTPMEAEKEDFFSRLERWWSGR